MGSASIWSLRLGLLTLSFSLAVPACTFAQEAPLTYPELSQDRIAAIAQMLPDKPAGFGVPCADRSAWAGIAMDTKAAIQPAEVLIAAPLPPWDDNAYLRFSRDGDRNEGQAMLERHTGQLTTLVLAECSEWQGRFLPRIAEQLDAISGEPSWTLPAHDPQLLNFNGKSYYVDLNAATLGHAVAEALYLLGEKIPADTRSRSMDALELHVFGPMRQAYAGKKTTYIGWLTAKHNWNAVCLNGVTDAALTILPERNERALFAAAAEHWISNYLDSFSDSGYDNEGIGYWVYGFSNYWELREQLWMSTEGKIDLFDDAKARKAAIFGFQFRMLPGAYADFGDAHFGYSPDLMFLTWIDRTFGLGVYNDDLGLIRMLSMTGSYNSGPLPMALPMIALAAFPNNSQRHDSDETALSLFGLRTYYPELGILVERPNRGGDFAITIKAGGNGNHSHNDVGSYSIGMKDTQPVGDPGGPGYYNADTFNSKRYTYRLLNSFGHPVPEIDGKLQLEATQVHPTVVSTNFTEGEDTIVMDITPAYDDPNLKKVLRTMKYSRAHGGSVELTDEFETAAPADVIESFPTHGTMRQIDAKTMQIDLNDAHVQISIDAPGKITVTQDKVDDMGNPFTRIGAAVHLEKSGKIVTHIRPVATQ